MGARDDIGSASRGPSAPFVGRLGPLALLERWWADAGEGRPRVVVLGGEAGIGKSSTVDRLLTVTADDDRVVLAGVCHEGLGVPYLPLAGALTALTDLPGRPAAAAAALELLTGGDASPAGASPTDPGTRRLAAFMSVTDALLAVAADRPVVLVLDDLHWADPATVDLLTQVVSAAAHRLHTRPVRMLVVLAHRLAESPTHVEGFLERLRREPTTRELVLTGLSEVEVNELLVALEPLPPSRGLLAAMHRSSGGNPLVVRTLWRHLRSSGLVGREGEELVATDPAGLVLDRMDATAAVRARLDALDPDALDVLVDAVVLGGHRQVDDLAALRGHGTLAPALERLAAVGILVDAGDGRGHRHLTVDHPEVALVAMSYVSPVERRERHARVVERLGPQSGHEPPLDLLDLAGHASAAGTHLDPDRSLQVAEPAAARALSIGAWDAAARYYDLAVEALDRGATPVEGHSGLTEPTGPTEPTESTGPTGPTEPTEPTESTGPTGPTEPTELLHRGLLAHFRNHDGPAIHRVGQRLVDRARADDDIDRWADGVMTMARAELTLGTDTLGRGTDAGPLLELLARLGDERPLLRGQVLGELAELHFNAWDFEGGVGWARRARAVLDEVDDPELGTRVEFAEGLQHLGRLTLGEAERCFRASAAHADQLADPWLRAWGRGRLPAVLWAAGRLDEAAEAVTEAIEVSEANHDWAELSLAAAFGAGVAALRGQFAAAERLAALAVANFHRSDYSFTPLVLYPTLTVARSLRGSVGGAEAALADWAAAGDGGQGARLGTLCRALAGERLDPEEVAAWPALGPSEPNLLLVPELAAQVEVGVAGGRDELVVAAGPALVALHQRGVRAVVGGCSSIARLVGVAEATGGRPEEAERWFAEAEAEAEAWGAPSEVARVRLDRASARLAAPSAHRFSVGDDLERAAEAFDRLGMLPLLARAEELLAVGGPPTATGRPARRLRALLVSDIVDSTRLTVAAGDDRWVEMLAEHDRIVRDALRGHDGVEFKHTGDGVLAWFDTPGQAIACALTLQPALDDANVVHPDVPLRVRCGIAAGRPIATGDDFFGVAVVRAVRVCATAGPGEVLVAAEVAALVETTHHAPFAVDAGTEVELKGLGSQRVHRARRRGAPDRTDR